MSILSRFDMVKLLKLKGDDLKTTCYRICFDEWMEIGGCDLSVLFKGNKYTALLKASKYIFENSYEFDEGKIDIFRVDVMLLYTYGENNHHKYKTKNEAFDEFVKDIFTYKVNGMWMEKVNKKVY